MAKVHLDAQEIYYFEVQKQILQALVGENDRHFQHPNLGKKSKKLYNEILKLLDALINQRELPKPHKNIKDYDDATDAITKLQIELFQLNFQIDGIKK